MAVPINGLITCEKICIKNGKNHLNLTHTITVFEVTLNLNDNY